MSKTCLYGAVFLCCLLLAGCVGLVPPPAGSGTGNDNNSNNGSPSNTGGGTPPPPAPPPPSSPPPSSPPPGPPPTITAVNHIVMIMQENRSFDHYFGSALNAYRMKQGLAAEIDGTPPNVSLQTFDGSPNVSPFHMISMCSENLSSSWWESHADWDMENQNEARNPPPMDGFAFTSGGFSHDTGGRDSAGKRSVGYYTDQDLPFYYWAATQFATSDRFFSAGPFRTPPNRDYLLAATTQGHVHPVLTGLTAKTIFELLEEHGISWKIYVTSGLSPGQTGDTAMNDFFNFTPKHVDHFVDAKTFATDAQNGTLPQVALIESGYENGEDEHPLNSVQLGAAYVESLFESLLNSPSWKDSVFFVTFDEGGGFYDHVPAMKTVNPDGIAPIDNTRDGDPPGDFTLTGFRVPVVIMSPFAKPHFVSHTSMDFTAMLKFIETRFNLPSLNNRDAFQPDMTEFFDWTAPNLKPGTPPNQPTDGPCYIDKLP